MYFLIRDGITCFVCNQKSNFLSNAIKQKTVSLKTFISQWVRGKKVIEVNNIWLSKLCGFLMASNERSIIGTDLWQKEGMGLIFINEENFENEMFEWSGFIDK